MPLNYNHQPSTSLNPAEILEAYAQWFSCVQQVLLYQTSQKVPLGIVAPSNFTKWAAEATGQAADLIPLHQQLVKQADHLVKQAIDTNQPPLFEEHQAFTATYNQFHTHLITTIENFCETNQGLSPLTGLKKEGLLKPDLERESNRLSRNGHSFVFALMKINNFTDLSASDSAAICKEAANIMQQTLRSYDDAYDLGDGHFAVALKQVTKSEGSTVLGRIANKFDAADAVKALPNKDIALLSCVAEPLPGDEIDALRASLQEQINRYDTNGSTVIEYIEISPFEKFVQSKQSS